MTAKKNNDVGGGGGKRHFSIFDLVYFIVNKVRGGDISSSRVCDLSFCIEICVHAIFCFFLL